MPYAADAPDPTFARIDAHRLAYAAFLATEPKSLDDPDEEAACQAEAEALDAVLATKPTTLVGAAASLRYVLDHDEEERGRLTTRFEEKLANPLLDYLGMLAAALEALA